MMTMLAASEEIMAFIVVTVLGGLAVSVLWLVGLWYGQPEKPPRDLALVATVFLFVASLLAFGCSATPLAPCMTGFELGVNGGETRENQNAEPYQQNRSHRNVDDPRERWDTKGYYVGGHGTVYFDTTGNCRAEG